MTHPMLAADPLAAPLAGWVAVVVLLAIGVGAAVFALRPGRARWVGVSAVALVASFVLTALSGTDAPVWVPIAVGLLAPALAVVAGGPIVVATLDLATDDTRAGAHGGILVAGPVAAGAGGHAEAPSAIGRPIEVLRGGTTIGVLERLAAAGAIMTGTAEAIAIVIAVKGVGRFSELASAEARERFIIGTLASLVWASACGVLARLYLA